jgi:hypothetical protein
VTTPAIPTSPRLDAAKKGLTEALFELHDAFCEADARARGAGEVPDTWDASTLFLLVWCLSHAYMQIVAHAPCRAYAVTADTMLDMAWKRAKALGEASRPASSKSS